MSKESFEAWWAAAGESLYQNFVSSKTIASLAYEAALAAEREACAQICDRQWTYDAGNAATCAEEIRARS